MLKQPKKIKHGTDAGYQAEYMYGIEPCKDCLAAHNKVNRNKYKPNPLRDIEHGTVRGYEMERRRIKQGTLKETCKLCRTAKLLYTSKYRN